MKTTIAFAIIIGLTSSGISLAEKTMKNVQQQEDIIHGYQKTNASPSQPASTDHEMKNVQQQEDIVHGYNQAAASPSQPATVKVGKSNREQQEDAVHGYTK